MHTEIWTINSSKLCLYGLEAYEIWVKKIPKNWKFSWFAFENFKKLPQVFKPNPTEKLLWFILPMHS